MEMSSGWWSSVVSLLEGTASRLLSRALSLPVGHLVVEEAWERLFRFDA